MPGNSRSTEKRHSGIYCWQYYYYYYYYCHQPIDHIATYVNSESAVCRIGIKWLFKKILRSFHRLIHIHPQNLSSANISYLFSSSCPPELRECCDLERCRLRAGSECAGGPCCALEPLPNVIRSTKTKYRCRLLSAGTVCRNASGTCDLPEYCDGKSQWCPSDVYIADGVPCRTDEGQRVSLLYHGTRIV